MQLCRCKYYSQLFLKYGAKHVGHDKQQTTAIICATLSDIILPF